jgi:hypothetical protein
MNTPPNSAWRPVCPQSYGSEGVSVKRGTSTCWHHTPTPKHLFKNRVGGPSTKPTPNKKQRSGLAVHTAPQSRKKVHMACCQDGAPASDGVRVPKATAVRTCPNTKPESTWHLTRNDHAARREQAAHRILFRNNPKRSSHLARSVTCRP